MIEQVFTFILYICVFSASALLLFLAENNNDTNSELRSKRVWLVTLAVTLPAVLAAFRLNVGTDYRTYVHLVEGISKLNPIQYLTEGYGGLEPAFYILSGFSEHLTDGPRIYFFISALIITSSFYLALKKLKTPRLPAVFFVLLMVVFLLSLNATRQMTAAALSFYAMSHLIVDKSIIRYSLFTLLAAAFHISALLLLPFVFLHQYIFSKDNLKIILFKFTPLAVIACLMLTLFITFGKDVALLDKFVQNNNTALSGSNKLFYLQAVLITAVLVLYKQTSMVNKYAPYLLFLALIEIMFIGMGFWSEYLKRYYLYFTPYLILLINSSIDTKQKYFTRKQLTILFILYAISFFALFYFILGHAEVTPYNYGIDDGIIH